MYLCKILIVNVLRIHSGLHFYFSTLFAKELTPKNVKFTDIIQVLLGLWKDFSVMSELGQTA